MSSSIAQFYVPHCNICICKHHRLITTQIEHQMSSFKAKGVFPHNSTEAEAKWSYVLAACNRLSLCLVIQRNKRVTYFGFCLRVLSMLLLIYGKHKQYSPYVFLKKNQLLYNAYICTRRAAQRKMFKMCANTCATHSCVFSFQILTILAELVDKLQIQGYYYFLQYLQINCGYKDIIIFYNTCR